MSLVDRGYPVTDAQVHVWADDCPARPWPPEGHARAHTFPAFQAAQLIPAMDSAGVARAVLVPPSFAGNYNDVAIEAAQQFPERFTVMARFDPAASGSESRLDALLATPQVSGFRMTYHRPEMWDRLASSDSAWFWRTLAARSVPVMVYAPGQNAALRDLGECYPDLRLIVDTLGLTLEMRDADLDAPIAELALLAGNPNVAVKATALPAHVTDEYPFRSLGPRLRRTVEIFGPERVFWASDLTRVPRPYREIVDFAADLDVFDAEELTWLMGRGISTWLDWPTH